MSRRPLTVVVAAVFAVMTGCAVVTPTTAAPGGSARSAASAVAPATPVPGPPTSGYLAHQGTTLFVNGSPYQVVGLDAYELATDWGNNLGCGGELDDTQLDAFFASLPPHSLVRMWGFQGAMATNPTTHTRDWTGLDRVVAAAQRHGDRLVVSLANQDGSCDDGHWKNPAWYSGGYRTAYPGDGYTVATVSYWDWVHEIVGRYESSPAIGMWELVNEPEASECAAGYSKNACYPHLHCDEAAAASALRSFFDTVGTEVKRIDPNHLVESGAMGGAQCGWSGGDYAMIHASPGLDVASYHDYSQVAATPADLTTRLAQMRTVGKPLIVGELGVQASDGTGGCTGTAARLAHLQAKSRALLAAGTGGVLFWDWVPNPQAGCSFDIGPGDPALGALTTTSSAG